MAQILKVCSSENDFSTEYEIIKPEEQASDDYQTVEEIDRRLSELQDQFDKLNFDIDKLTNNSDWIDYSVAVASGVITGLVDIFFVGEIDVKGATEKVNKKVADKVKDKALQEKINDTIKEAKQGAKEKGRKLTDEEIRKIKENVTKRFFSDPNNLAEQGGNPVLERAIRYLEKKHPVLQDSLFKGTGSSPSNHHLADVAHHPTFAGLIASIVIQYFRVAKFVNKNGKISFRFVSTDIKDLISNWLPIILTGMLNWLVAIAEKSQKDGKLHTDIPKPIFVLAHLIATAPAAIEITKIANTWCLHLYSDVAGSHSSAKKGNRGAGIPGLFISLLQEISSIPPMNMTGLPKLVNYLYETQQVDLRKEIAIFEELGKQAIPIIINELLVRGFYFIRSVVVEYQIHDGWKDINWSNVVPFGNRTVERMMTIASGTFTAVDLIDATVDGLKEAAATPGETGVKAVAFAKEFALNVNFVGIGRLTVQIGVDVGMGVKRAKLINERIALSTEMLNLSNAKIQYNEDGMMKVANSTGEAINRLYMNAEEGYRSLKDMNDKYHSELDELGDMVKGIEKNNPGLIDELFGDVK